MELSAASAFKTSPRYHELSRGITAEIIKHIDLAHGMLLNLGIPTRAYTQQAVKTLLEFSEERQLQVLESAKNLIGVAASFSPETEPEIEDDAEVIDEVALTKKALGLFNFSLRDQTWETTAQERIIEIYNNNGVQLYRSMNFFKTCGYSLLDLCVYEWHVLWERPRRVINQMNEVVTQTLTGAPRESSAVNIPPHIVRETLDDGTTQPFLPRSMVVAFKDIYPAYSASGDIVGFVVTYTAKLVSVGDEALKLDFI